MPPPIDHTGRVFGRLTAIEFNGRYSKSPHGYPKRLWKFKCECGVECEKIIEKVVRGWVKSCGCLKSTRTKLEGLQHAVFSDSYNDGTITEEQFLKLSQEPCHYCNSPPCNTRTHRTYRDVKWTYQGLDRLDSSKSHDYDNIVPCCWVCNEKKKKTDYIVFLKWIETIYINRVMEK